MTHALQLRGRRLASFLLCLGSLSSSACSTSKGDDNPADGREVEEAIQEILEDALNEAPAGVDGMSLIVRDQNDALVVEMTAGEFSIDRRVAIASASKWISGLIILRAVHEGVLEMSDSPASILNWAKGNNSDATLDQLGAFVSGMEPEATCSLLLKSSLQECATMIGEMTPAAPPGTRFDYGSTHLTVAGAMTEVATASSWAELFENFKSELELEDAKLRYYTFPRQELGLDNPLIAGGLRSTAAEYMRMLAVVFHQGKIGDDVWIDSELMLRFQENGYPEVAIGKSPMADAGVGWRYGFGSWLGCEGGSLTCPVVSSPGAFGFTPWVDFENGYYAVLSLESQAGGAQFSVPIMQKLMPKIEALLK